MYNGITKWPPSTGLILGHKNLAGTKILGSYLSPAMHFGYFGSCCLKTVFEQHLTTPYVLSESVDSLCRSGASTPIVCVHA